MPIVIKFDFQMNMRHENESDYDILQELNSLDNCECLFYVKNHLLKIDNPFSVANYCEQIFHSQRYIEYYISWTLCCIYNIEFARIMKQTI